MAKFKVGDWVNVILPPVAEVKSTDKLIVRILEVVEQTCEAGITQTSYWAQVWSGFGKRVGFSSQMKLREMELGEKVEMI